MLKISRSWSAGVPPTVNTPVVATLSVLVEAGTALVIVTAVPSDRANESPPLTAAPAIDMTLVPLVADA